MIGPELRVQHLADAGLGRAWKRATHWPWTRGWRCSSVWKRAPVCARADARCGIRLRPDRCSEARRNAPPRWRRSRGV